jgi:hypothetical protein
MTRFFMAGILAYLELSVDRLLETDLNAVVSFRCFQ